jgi:hypothetical protein
MQPMICFTDQPLSARRFARRVPTTQKLEQERLRLEEEVRQLRAAVQIYTEVARRLACGAQVTCQ